jgi:hypothetical protein
VAIRGSWESDSGDEYRYEVVQYRMLGNDHIYERGASWDKLDSDDLDFARISVTREGGSGEAQIVTFYGPYLDQDDLEHELDAAFRDDNYGEVVG